MLLTSLYKRWRWLGKLKRPDGGFSVSQGGEIDVRSVSTTVTCLYQLTDYSGAYCAMVLISLLRLPLELPHDAPTRLDGKTSFLDDLPEWLSQCKWVIPVLELAS